MKPFENVLLSVKLWQEQNWNSTLMGWTEAYFPYLGTSPQNKKNHVWKLWQEVLCFLNTCFVKFLICVYWAKNVTVFSLSLHVVYSIYYFLGFSKYVYLFFKSFLLKLFTILYVTFLTSEIKFATYKDATIKMYCLWRTFATFSIFSHAMQCLHICIKCGKTGRQNKLKMLLPSN